MPSKTENVFVFEQSFQLGWMKRRCHRLHETLSAAKVELDRGRVEAARELIEQAMIEHTNSMNDLGIRLPESRVGGA